MAHDLLHIIEQLRVGQEGPAGGRDPRNPPPLPAGVEQFPGGDVSTRPGRVAFTNFFVNMLQAAAGNVGLSGDFINSILGFDQVGDEKIDFEGDQPLIPDDFVAERPDVLQKPGEEIIDPGVGPFGRPIDGDRKKRFSGTQPVGQRRGGSTAGDVLGVGAGAAKGAATGASVGGVPGAIAGGVLGLGSGLLGLGGDDRQIIGGGGVVGPDQMFPDAATSQGLGIFLQLIEMADAFGDDGKNDDLLGISAAKTATPAAAGKVAGAAKAAGTQPVGQIDYSGTQPVGQAGNTAHEDESTSHQEPQDDGGDPGAADKLSQLMRFLGFAGQAIPGESAPLGAPADTLDPGAAVQDRQERTNAARTAAGAGGDNPNAPGGGLTGDEIKVFLQEALRDLRQLPGRALEVGQSLITGEQAQPTGTQVIGQVEELPQIAPEGERLTRQTETQSAGGTVGGLAEKLGVTGGGTPSFDPSSVLNDLSGVGAGGFDPASILTDLSGLGAGGGPQITPEAGGLPAELGGPAITPGGPGAEIPEREFEDLSGEPPPIDTGQGGTAEFNESLTGLDPFGEEFGGLSGSTFQDLFQQFSLPSFEGPLAAPTSDLQRGALNASSEFLQANPFVDTQNIQQSLNELVTTGGRFDNSEEFAALEAVNKRRLEEESAALNEQFGTLGARFGSDIALGQGDLRARALQNEALQRSTIARQSFEAAQQRRLGALPIGAQLQTAQLRDIGGIFGLGEQERQIGERGIDRAMAEFARTQGALLPLIMQFLSAGAGEDVTVID